MIRLQPEGRIGSDGGPAEPSRRGSTTVELVRAMTSHRRLLVTPFGGFVLALAPIATQQS